MTEHCRRPWTRYKYKLHSRRCVRTQLIIMAHYIFSFGWSMLRTNFSVYNLYDNDFAASETLNPPASLYHSIVCAVPAEHVSTHSECPLSAYLSSTMLFLRMNVIFGIFLLHIYYYYWCAVRTVSRAAELNSFVLSRCHATNAAGHEISRNLWIRNNWNHKHRMFSSISFNRIMWNLI